MYKRQIARGMELLDRHYPGWVQRVNLDTLDLRDCQDCVVGQLGPGDFYDNARDLNRHELMWLARNVPVNGREMLRNWKDYGFDIDQSSMPWSRHDDAYGQLTKEWVKAVEKRRRAEPDKQLRLFQESV